MEAFAEGRAGLLHPSWFRNVRATAPIKEPPDRLTYHAGT